MGFIFGEERAIRRQKAIVNIKIWAGKTAEKGIICMMFSRKNERCGSQYNKYRFLTGYLDSMP